MLKIVFRDSQEDMMVDNHHIFLESLSIRSLASDNLFSITSELSVVLD